MAAKSRIPFALPACAGGDGEPPLFLIGPRGGNRTLVFHGPHLASDLAADILVYFRRTIWPWIQKTNAQTESNRKRSSTQGMHMPVKSLRPSSHLFSLLLSVSSSASPSITPFSLSLFWNEHCCTGPHFSRIPAFEASREQSVTERARWSV